MARNELKAAQVLDIPQVWTSSTEEEDSDWWLPELAELDPAAFEAQIKRTGIVDSWGQPEFVQAVEATGRKTLLMTGTSVDSCLLYTVFGAKRAGYNMWAIVDAAGGRRACALAARRCHALRDIAYGDDPRQRFDVFLPAQPHVAPIILFVHGEAGSMATRTIRASWKTRPRAGCPRVTSWCSPITACSWITRRWTSRALSHVHSPQYRTAQGNGAAMRQDRSPMRGRSMALGVRYEL